MTCSLLKPGLAIRLALGLFLAGLALVCLLSTSSSAETLRAAIPSEPISLDPHRSPDPRAWTFIYPCYQRLVAFKETTTEIKPALALTWRVSADGRLYTFVLADGLTFSDGQRVEAEAVRTSFQRLFRLGESASALFPSLVDVKVLGPQTVRFVLSRPDATFLPALAAPAASIVSPGVANRPPDFLNRNTLGSGLYHLDSWTAGREVTLKIRSDQLVRPKIDRFTALIVPDPGLALNLLKAGQVDIAEGLGPAELTLAKADPLLAIQNAPTFVCGVLAINCRHPWLKQAEARRAISYAVDVEGLINRVYYGAAQRMFGPVPLGLWGHREDVPRYDHNPDLARSMIDRIGPPTGPLILAFGPTLEQRREAELIKADLEAIGLNVQLKPVTEETTVRRLGPDDFDLALDRSWPKIASPEAFLWTWLSSASAGDGGNLAYYQNSELDQLLEAAALNTDKEGRLSTYYQIQEIVGREAPYVFLYQLSPFVGRTRRLENLKIHPWLIGVYPLAELSLTPAASQSKK